MKENIKLAFEEPDFRINHKKNRVRCILKFSLKGDQKTLQMLNAFHQIMNDPLDNVVVVDVTPSNEDEFCVDTGMKVARGSSFTAVGNPAPPRPTSPLLRAASASSAKLVITGA